MSWQLQEAKNKLSEVIQKAQTKPQWITRHGQETAVVLSAQAYRKLTKKKKSLAQILRESPLANSHIKIERPKDAGRDLDQLNL